MSSISAISGGVQSNVFNAAVSKKPGTAAATSLVRDADGDHDGTRAGQTDAKDFGKGVNLDRTA
jgi:hypothetical protein